MVSKQLKDLEYSQLSKLLELLESETFIEILAPLLLGEEEAIVNKIAATGRATDVDAGEIRGLRRIASYHDEAFDLKEDLKKTLDKQELQ
jgi:hypothetical protein